MKPVPCAQVPGRRLATDSSDSDSPYASPAGSLGPCQAVQAVLEEEDNRSQHSSHNVFAVARAAADLGSGIQSGEISISSRIPKRISLYHWIKQKIAVRACCCAMQEWMTSVAQEAAVSRDRARQACTFLCSPSVW